MASITVTSGKYRVERNDNPAGDNPFANILPEADGAACIMKDFTGKVWIFYITGSALYCKKSTDTEGTSYGSPVTIESVRIKDGVPSAEELKTGKVVVFYHKDNETNNPPTKPGTLKVLLVGPTGTIAIGKSATTIGFLIANGGKDVDMPWTAAISGSGFSVSPGSGTEPKKDYLLWKAQSLDYGVTWTKEIVGTVSVTVTVAANTGYARTGTLTITAAGATESPVTVTINQAAGNV